MGGGGWGGGGGEFLGNNKPVKNVKIEVNLSVTFPGGGS